MFSRIGIFVLLSFGAYALATSPSSSWAQDASVPPDTRTKIMDIRSGTRKMTVSIPVSGKGLTEGIMGGPGTMLIDSNESPYGPSSLEIEIDRFKDLGSPWEGTPEVSPRTFNPSPASPFHPPVVDQTKGECDSDFLPPGHDNPIDRWEAGTLQTDSGVFPTSVVPASPFDQLGDAKTPMQRGNAELETKVRNCLQAVEDRYDVPEQQPSYELPEPWYTL
jgi:hypothetical protein